MSASSNRILRHLDKLTATLLACLLMAGLATADEPAALLDSEPCKAQEPPRCELSFEVCLAAEEQRVASLGDLGAGFRLARDENQRPIGVGIVSVAADSPAQKAGLKRHDLVVGWNGHSFSVNEKELPFLAVLNQLDQGDTILLEVRRQTRKLNVELVAGAFPKQRVPARVARWVKDHYGCERYVEYTTRHGMQPSGGAVEPVTSPSRS